MRHRIDNEDAVRWLRGLPEQCADAMVTDPPFCSGGFNESGSRSTSASSASDQMPWFRGDSMGTIGISHLMREVAVAAQRVIRPGGTLTVFTDWRMAAIFAAAFESGGWRWRNEIIWDKGSPGPGTGFRYQHEKALHFDRCDAVYQRHDVPNVIRCPRRPNKQRIHPTEKPVALLQQILRVVCPPGGTVLDPFGGSGSLVEAAHRAGVSAWVCDADPTYVEAARARAATVAQQDSLEGLL